MEVRTGAASLAYLTPLVRLLACPLGYAVQEKLERRQVVALASDQDFSRWERLDDVIMGGQSESTLKAGADGTAVFEGTLRVEGGGFCGARTRVCACVLGDWRVLWADTEEDEEERRSNAALLL